MKYKFKKLKPEDIQVGDLYLVGIKTSYNGLVGRIRPTRIRFVSDRTICYISECDDYDASEDIRNPQGILVKRTKKGKLEFYVGKEFLESLESLESELGLSNRIPQFSSEPELGPSLDI